MHQVVREKLFRRLRQEVPYALGLRAEHDEQLPDGSLLLRQAIIVPSDQVTCLTA